MPRSLDALEGDSVSLRPAERASSRMPLRLASSADGILEDEGPERTIADMGATQHRAAYSGARTQDAVYRQCGLDAPLLPPESWERGRPQTFSPETRKAYQFATENIAAFIGELDLDGRNVACIAGSGDFPVNAWLYGAARVDAVDVSPVACFYTELKMAGVALLEYEEFLGFFATRDWRTFGSGSFSFKVYERLRAALSDAARAFFDVLITPEGRHPYLEQHALLMSSAQKLYRVKGINPYLQGRFRYLEAKQRLRPTLLHPQRVDEFLAARPRLYDVVHLSNVHKYGADARELVTLAAEALRDGGQIVMCSFRREEEKDANGCLEWVQADVCWDLPRRIKYSPDGLGYGTMRTHIFDVPGGASR